MKKKSKRTKFTLFSMLVIGIVLISIVISLLRQTNYPYLLYLTILLLGIYSIVYLVSIKTRKLKYQKINLILSIFLLLSCVFIIQPKKGSEDSYVGIDISKWNGDVDLQNAYQELDFVIIRCGYTSISDGVTRKEDDKFKENIKQCKDLGIPYGVYYYSCATNVQLAKKEAQYTLSLLDGDTPPLGIYIDLENEQYQSNLSKDQLTNIALSFLDEIENTQNFGGIYANYYWWNNKLHSDQLDTYLRWLALYDDYPVEDEYHIHQYTATGVLDGLVGEFDINTVKYKFW